MEFSGRYSVGLKEVRGPVTGRDGIAEHHEHITGVVTDNTQQLLCSIYNTHEQNRRLD